MEIQCRHGVDDTTQAVFASSHRWKILLPAIASALIACGAAPAKKTTTAPDAKPAVVVIDHPHWDFRWTAEWSSTEAGLSDCLSDELVRSQDEFDVILASAFNQTIFPDLPADLAPGSPKYIKLALKDPEVQSRIEARRIKYLIHIGGTTEVAHDWGDILCGSTNSGGGCAGLMVANKVSEVSALVMDVDAIDRAINVHSASQGKNWFAVVGFFPVWYLAPTREAACKALASEIIKEM